MRQQQPGRLASAWPVDVAAVSDGDDTHEVFVLEQFVDDSVGATAGGPAAFVLEGETQY
jgi:hypothetical protein